MKNKRNRKRKRKRKKETEKKKQKEKEKIKIIPDKVIKQAEGVSGLFNQFKKGLFSCDVTQYLLCACCETKDKFGNDKAIENVSDGECAKTCARDSTNF